MNNIYFETCSLLQPGAQTVLLQCGHLATARFLQRRNHRIDAQTSSQSGTSAAAKHRLQPKKKRTAAGLADSKTAATNRKILKLLSDQDI
jgi:hypothetical protein